MEKLKKHGKGIVLVHDFQRATAEAAMDLLNDLKAGGYKIVFMQPKFAVTTIASYDEAIMKQVKGPVSGTCFAGPHSPWSPPFGPLAPPQLPPPRIAQARHSFRCDHHD
jgi:hypothetical protein